MKSCFVLGWWLLVVITLASGNAADGLGSIAGFVRDVDGKPISGATITLTAQQTPTVTMQATSDQQGYYHFNQIPFGDFKVSVALEGYIATGSRLVAVSETASNAKVDFTLRTQTVSEVQGPPKLEAAGVRGLIDPGGYSAGANAAAASGLIKGVADIKREDKYPSESAEHSLPCSLEPGLKAEVEANPDSAIAKQKLGNFYVSNGQPSKAIPLLQQAYQIDSSDLKIVEDLAIAYLRNEQFEAARELLAPLGEKRNDTKVHQLLARADEGLGMFVPSSQEYEMAAALQPAEVDFFGAGYELILAGKPPEAVRAFQAGLSQYPNSIELLMGTGAAEFLQGNVSGGIQEILHATDLAPYDPRPYALLSSASEIYTDESAKVLGAFKRFAEIAPENPDAAYYYALSMWNLRAGGISSAETDEITRLLKRAIQLKPEFANPHFLLGEIYSQREDYGSAVREYQNTLRLEPNRKEAHYRLANAYKHTGQTALAAQELRLFQEEKARQATSGNAPSIVQFVSVIASAGNSTSPEVPCP
jgi:tetratricopeptide (TPR) repeat protein